MAILTCNALISGAVGFNPREWTITTNNTFAQVTESGFLTQYQAQYGFLSSDWAKVYTTDIGTIGLSINVSASGVVSFINNYDSALVTLPVVSGNLSMFDGTTGLIKDSSIIATNVMQLNAVNTLASGARVIANKVSQGESGGVVTASGMSGVITTSAQTTIAGGSTLINWTNTFISATSTVFLSIMGGTNTRRNIEMVVVPGSGSATLTIYNVEPTNALNGTILIGYLVI